jgi:CubicO group peptidase (beta-lactamase class C family)
VDKESLPAEAVEIIEKSIAEGLTPGIAIALIDSSGIHHFNFGKTTSDGTDVNEHTIYEIGSITKAFTGILLAQQVLDEDIQLDQEISTLLPDSLKIPVVGDIEITFGNLTDHTSGLPRMPYNFNPANPNNPFADYSVEQMYEFISNYQPTRPVGSAYEYSNIGQGLLGHLLALNRNTTYEDLMIQAIATPLQMADTRIIFTSRMKENLAPGHSNGEVVENWDLPTLAGAGAIRSSAADMAKFISANLGYTNTPLTEAMSLSHQIRHNKAGNMSVAMAWHVKKDENQDIIWHNGRTGGYCSFVGFNKETGKGIVLLTNSSTYADDITEIGLYIMDPDGGLTARKFKSDAIILPESLLKQYLGVYELQPNLRLTITKEGTQLYGQVTGQQPFEMYAENDTSFFLTAVKAQITFRQKEGKVESLTLYQLGQKITGRKIAQ